MSTFKELYEFLQTHSIDAIHQWLDEGYANEKGYKQEAMLRLLGGLGLIAKLDKFYPCVGNFNKKNIDKQTSFNQLFYKEKGKLIKYRGNGGDASDFTMMSKHNNKHLLAVSSKCLTKEQSGELDIEKMFFFADKYKSKGYTITYGFCVPSKKKTDEMIARAHGSSEDLSELYNRKDTIVIDRDDLSQALYQYKTKFPNRPFDTILESKKRLLLMRLHQRLSIFKTLRMKESGKKQILWGHIQRSGKSYIMAGCIIDDSKGRTPCNYMIITTAPSTITQFVNKSTNDGVLDCLELQDFNVVQLDGSNKDPKLGNKNIIVCSIQFLKDKKGPKTIEWLKNMDFEMKFVDEIHDGGTTEKSQQALTIYGKNACTIQVTATYSKPTIDYNIPRDCWILWDLEDIRLCKNINGKSTDRLVEKHGNEIKDFINEYSIENLTTEYSKFSELQVLTWDINEETKSVLIERCKNSDQGWSTESCLLGNWCLKKLDKKETPKFQSKENALDLFNHLFGEWDEFGIKDGSYPQHQVFMEKIKDQCIYHGTRHIDDMDDPMTIMCFLPRNNIEEISRCTQELLEQEHPLFHPKKNRGILIVRINTKVSSGDAMKRIKDAQSEAKRDGKKGVLVLSGEQCHLGVTIPNCDVVILLNNTKSYDKVWQMIFRGMTEAANKKFGFVIDLNIHRVINTIMEYGSKIKPLDHPIKAIYYMLKERLIGLNSTHWNREFRELQALEHFCGHVYDIYSSSNENVIDQLITRLKSRLLLSTTSNELFNSNFDIRNPTAKKIQNNTPEDEQTINKGIEKTAIETDGKKDVVKMKYMDMLQHLIPMVCLLTINSPSTCLVEMFNVILHDSRLTELFIAHIVTCWGEQLTSKHVSIIISIYEMDMQHDDETVLIVRTIKELFIKSRTNTKDLGELVDTYFIPQELEKKTNAEYSTPYKLRQEMLDKIPTDFWKTVRPVFEPCAGKGGFVVDIMSRFMIGLKDTILDENERRKVIIEECLYFSDINSTNIFICKLLIDPNNTYKLNYNEGDTLKLDITADQENWKGLNRFDAVIGNPPYNDDSGNKGKGHILWDKFIETSLDMWINDNGYLLFVNPSLWRQADHPLQQKMKQYQIEYLEIHNESDGFKTFKCNTRYDWYLIHKKIYYKNTEIKTQKGDIVSKYLTNMNFIPNYNYDLIDKLTSGSSKINMLYSRSDYASDKKWTSKTKDNEYKYPVVYSVNRKHTAKFIWSKINSKEGHYNQKKVIFGSGATGFITDENGDYACCEWCTGIIDDIENLQKIKEALDSKKFKDEIVLASSVSKAEINRKILKYFNKDFWKEFV